MIDSSPEALGTAEDTRPGGENTLLSVGAAAGQHEARDPRVEELERRVEQLEARLTVIELARGAADDSKRRALFWVGLLLALALGWQLRAFLR